MLEIIAKTKRYMWDFVELGFVAVLAIMLVYLVLGKDSGVFVLAVAGNVIKFTNDVPAGNLVALAIVGALLYWFTHRSSSSAPSAGSDISQLIDRALRKHVATSDKPVPRG
jgi:formate/nitrite transporter FocA (FNT family)